MAVEEKKEAASAAVSHQQRTLRVPESCQKVRWISPQGHDHDRG
tara:strand:- start:457 stop:588 length:132 start_codon:yes stop_codon:yes gene_type:complete